MLWSAKKLHHPIAILDLSDFDDFFSDFFLEAVNESRQLLVAARRVFSPGTATRPRFLSTQSGVVHPGAVALRGAAPAVRIRARSTWIGTILTRQIELDLNASCVLRRQLFPNGCHSKGLRESTKISRYLRAKSLPVSLSPF